MPDPQHKLVKVDDSIIKFPSEMPDADVAAVIKKFTSSPDYKKQTHTKNQMPSGITTEESEHKRLTGNVPTVTPDWNTVRQAVYKATEPTLPNPNTKPVDNSVKANMDAAWNAGANAANVGGNIAKRAGRVIFGAVDMAPQMFSILSKLGSSDDKVSQQAETDLLGLHPGAQIADRLKEAVHDWRKSKSLAAENALGDVLGFFLLDKAGKVLPEERIKQLNAEGVVLPPEAKPAIQKAPTLADVKTKAEAVKAFKPEIAPQTAPHSTTPVAPPEPKVETPASQPSTAVPPEPSKAEAPPAPKEEPQTTKYKYGNTQADIDPKSDAGKALATARTQIDKNDLMPSTNTTDGSGLEENAHITVRYGIDGEDTAGIKEYLEKQAPFEATLGKTTAFPPSEHSDGGAPIVVNIESPELHRMEKEIDQHGNFVDRSFPEYKPHVTLGYVKPEAAQKYVGMKDTEGKKFTVNSVSISNKDGSIEEVPLKGTPDRRGSVRETQDRRQDAGQRKRIAEMNADEMRKILLTSDVVDLPNRRAFNEAELDHPSPAVARSDADALKAFNDKFGYANGDALLRAKADALKQAGLEAYHEKGDEFLFRGQSGEELQNKLDAARDILRNTVFDVTLDDGTKLQLKGVDFSYGTGKDLSEAESNQHAHKQQREESGERKRGELVGLTEVGAGKN